MCKKERQEEREARKVGGSLESTRVDGLKRKIDAMKGFEGRIRRELSVAYSTQREKIQRNRK